MGSATTDRRLGLTADRGFRAPCALATTANITLSGEQTIDGVLTSASRVLVKNQTDQTTNGLYDSSSAAWTRCIDANGNGDFVKGQLVGVTGGAQATTYWRVSSSNPITVGSSAVTFVQDLTGANPSGVLATVVDQSIAFTAGTLGAIQRNVGAPRALASFGALNNDGATDDAATWQAAAASGVRCIDARGLNCKINSAINIPSNQTWLLHGTQITISSSTISVFNCDTVTDWRLLGPFTITGAGTTVGTAKGVSIKDCSNYYIDRPIFKTIQGWGMYVDPGASTSLRSQHGAVNELRADQCYVGYQDLPGTGAEYSTLVNPHITRCSLAGLITAAGNVVVFGGQIVDNILDGVVINNGANHAHGIFVGVNINHQPQYNIRTNQVTNGQSFVGCHIYALNNAGSGAIFLDRSKGIIFDGGHFDGWIYNDKDGSSGLNIMRNMFCPGSQGDILLTAGPNPGQDQFLFTDCYGAGAYTSGVSINDPSPVFVLASRVPAATQALTSGVAADLLFPTKDFDRRAALAAATGIFTVPAGMAGTYRVRGNLHFDSAGGMTPASSFVELKLNNASGAAVFFGSIFGTQKLGVPIHCDLYLNAADTLRLNATITATTPTFSDSTWKSFLSIERIS